MQALRTFNIMDTADNELVQKFFEITSQKFETESVNLSNYVASQVKRLWGSTAKSTARHASWGEKYANTIKIEPMQNKDGYARVFIDDSEFDKDTGKRSIMWVNMVEKGIRTWSIRDALLNSKRVKTNSEGMKYIRVPFRWKTPSSTAKTSEVFTGTMSEDVHKIVKTGVALKGEKFGHMQGMKRYSSGGNRGAYFTFRTVSEKTPKDQWQYPETPGTPVYEKVANKVGKLIGAVLDDYIKGYVNSLKEGA